MNRTWLWRRNPQSENESILIAAQNIDLRINYIKVKNWNTQINGKCRFRGHRDETVNLIISECSKLSQKEYKTTHDWVGKVIHWELCKRLKLYHTHKWYIHEPESVLEKKTILLSIEIQTDHLFPARRTDQVLINKKKNLLYCRFRCSS